MKKLNKKGIGAIIAGLAVASYGAYKFITNGKNQATEDGESVDPIEADYEEVEESEESEEEQN